MNCKLCNFSHENLKRFSDHLRSEHHLTSEQYTVKVFHDGIKPICQECGSDTRYVSFSFKKYCKEHSKLAMTEGGKIGGKAEAWNRGLTKETDIRIADLSLKMSGKGNPFYGKSHSLETIQKISLNKTLESTTLIERILERQGEFNLVTPLEEYKSRQCQYLKFQCVACGEVQKKTLQAFERGSRCYKCHPLGKSNWELSVFDFVRSLSSEAVSGDKSILSPKEIDIYIPSKRFGIECHGLYWHSEAAPQDQSSIKIKHLEKLKLSLSEDINLLQIFEDEWKYKRDVCESMIRHRLGLNFNKVKTWSTKIEEISTEEERIFFNKTHISGYTPSKVCWSLKDRNGNIVAALSLRTPRQSKYNGSLEIARFSTSLFHSVPGGLSKLIKHATKYANSSGYKSIMTYVDRRIGEGKGYINAGFNLIGSTSPDYWYTDCEVRYDRFKFRAKNGMSEREVAIDAKVYKIWGCGSHIFEMKLQ